MKSRLFCTFALIGSLAVVPAAHAYDGSAVAGAVVGAGAGAMMGQAFGGGTGAIVGGMFGAAAGTAIATANTRVYASQPVYYQQQPAPSPCSMSFFNVPIAS